MAGSQVQWGGLDPTPAPGVSLAQPWSRVSGEHHSPLGHVVPALETHSIPSVRLSAPRNAQADLPHARWTVVSAPLGTTACVCVRPWHTEERGCISDDEAWGVSVSATHQIFPEATRQVTSQKEGLWGGSQPVGQCAAPVLGLLGETQIC